MNKKRVLVCLVIAVMLVSSLALFAGCTDPNKITFLLDWAPNTNHTGLFVAKHLGYYDEEGLKVSLIQPNNMGQSASVAGGNAQFGIDFQEQMIYNESKGVGITAVASIIQHNTSGLVSLKSEGIDTPAKMVGKKYATWDAPGEKAIVKQMMINAGVDPESLTMENKYVESIESEFQLPKDKRVDLVWSFAGWDLVKLDLAGMETNFIEMRNIPGLDYYTPVIIVNNEYKDKYPEKVTAFVRATAKGYKYAIEHPREAADILIEEAPELAVNKDLIYNSLDYLAKEYQSDAPYWGHIDAARWDGFFNLICSMKDQYPDYGFPADITDGYGFTNEFLPKE